MSKKIVFISSTYSDLKPHRKEIWNVLQEYDVEITGMEEFGARTGTPMETCLDEINRSDIYIGVISMRYGSVDPITGKSYTQLEYERAKEKGLEIFIYLVDEHNGIVRTGNIDFGDKALRLNSLKEIIKSNHTTDFFTDGIDLRDKVLGKFKNILPNKNLFRQRPDELEADLILKKIGGKNWFFIVGYLLGKPFEIFSAPEYSESDENGLFFPKTVKKGVLKRVVRNGELIYNFSYQNKRGFKTTFEGIDYNVTPDITNLCSVISGMIQGRVDMDTITGLVSKMKVSDKKYKNWNKEAIKILNGIK